MGWEKRNPFIVISLLLIGSLAFLNLVLAAGINNVVLLSPENNTWTSGTNGTIAFVFNYSGENESAVCTLFLNASSEFAGANASSASNSTNTTLYSNLTIEEGARQWYVNCTNETLTNQSYIFTLNVDRTKPYSKINRPLNSTVNSDSFNFTYNDSSLNCSWYSVDDGSNTTSCSITGSEWSGTLSIASDGLHNITVWANDSAGNENSTVAFWIRDIAKPIITVQTPLNQSYNFSSIWFNVTLNENGDTCLVDYGWGNNTMENTTGNWNYTNASMNDGSYQAIFYCNDTVGNLNSTDKNFTIDTVHPYFTAYARNPDPPNEDQAVEVNVTLSEAPNTVILEVNNGTKTNYTITTSNGLEYYFTISNTANVNYTAHDQVNYTWFANDSANNGNWSAQQTFIVANQIPSVSQPSVNNTAPQTNDNISCTGGVINDNDAEDVEQNREYRWYDGTNLISGQTFQNLSLAISGLDKGDLINCSIRVYDDYDWSAWVNSSNTAAINNTPPTTPNLGLPANGTRTNDNTPFFNWTASSDADGDAINYSVEISTDLGFSSVSEANYTLADNNYTAPVLTDGLYYWRVWAVTSDANSSLSGVYNFTVDTTPPFIFVISPANMSYNLSSLWFNVTLNENADACILYLWWGGNRSMTNSTGNWNYLNASIIESEFEAKFYCNDTTGNMNMTSINFTVDRTAPSAITIATIANASYNYNPQLNFSFYDLHPDSCWYSLNDSANITLASCSTNETVLATGEGGQNVRLCVNDTAGNENCNQVYYTKDTIKPTIIITIPPNTTTDSDNFSFAYDHVNCSVYWVDGDSNSNVTNCSIVALEWNGTFPALSDGPHNVTVWANDSAGNTNSTTRYWRRDVELPIITIVSPLETYYSTDPQLNFSYVEANPDTCWYSLNGTANITLPSCDTNETVLISGEGQNNVTLCMNDTSGKFGYDFVNYTKDSSTPIITIILPQNASYNVSSRSFNITISKVGDTCLVDYGWGNNSMATSNGLSWSYTNSSMNEGSYQAKFFCNDSLENSDTDNVNFTIDLTRPTITIQSPLNQTYNVSSIWFNVTLSEPGSTCLVNYTAGNQTMTNSSGNWHYNASLSDGQYHAVFYCNDTAGNWNSTNFVYFKLDVPIYCDSCSDCNDKIQAASDGKIVMLNTSINTSDNYCIDLVGENNKNFDCNWNNITGNGAGNTGIRLGYAENETIRNCLISNFTIGIRLLPMSMKNRFTDTISQENTDADVRVLILSEEYCANNFTNITGSGGRPIEFYNYSVNIENKTLSELILCNADGSNVTNVTIMGSDSLNNNELLLLFTDNATLTNVTSIGNNYGINVSVSNRNMFTNVTLTQNERGIIFTDSYNNTMKNSKIENNSVYGIGTESSWDNSFYNNLFNNTNSIYLLTEGGNNFNTNINCSAGPNIIGGNCIGGNYWNNWTIQGFSETCVDWDADGICDVSYKIVGGDYDFYPLAPERPPFISINSPNNDTISSDLFNFTYNEVNCSVYRVDGGSNVTNCSIAGLKWAGTLSALSDGQHNITVWANDSAGNTNSTTRYWIRDTTPPAIFIVLPQNITYNTSTIKLNVSSDGSEHAWRYNLNGAGEQGFGPNTTITAQYGSNTIWVYVNDTAGNVNASSVVFYLNATAPRLEAPVHYATDDGGWGESHTFYVNCSDADGQNVSLRLWYRRTASDSWSLIGQQNCSGLTPYPYFFTTNTFDCSNVTPSNQNSSYMFNASDQSSLTNETSPQNFTIAKDDVSFYMNPYSERSVWRNGTASLILSVAITDADNGGSAAPGTNATLWITKNASDPNSWDTGKALTVNASGYMGYYFFNDSQMPMHECNYTVGMHNWTAGVGGINEDSCYKTTNSSTYNSSMYNLTVWGELSPRITYPTSLMGFLVGDQINVTGYVEDDCSYRTGLGVEGVELRFPDSTAQRYMIMGSVSGTPQRYCTANWQEGGGWYNCTWDSSLQQRIIWNISMNVNKTYYASNSTMAGDAFHLGTAPEVSAPAATPNTSGWGTVFDLSVAFADDDMDNNTISLWTSYDNSTWQFVNSTTKSSSGTTVNFYQRFNCGDALAYPGRKIYFKFNTTDPFNYTAETTSSTFNLTFDNVTVSLNSSSSANVSMLNATAALIFRIYDSSNSTYPSGIGGIAWVAENGVNYTRLLNCTTSGGYCTVSYRPNSSTSIIGTQYWKAGSNESCYEYHNSTSQALEVTNPINATGIYPYVIVNGSATNISVYVSGGYASVWANVTLPDANVSKLMLTNNANTSFSQTNLTGRYNVTFYANDSSGNLVNRTGDYYFEAFPPVTLNLSVISSNSSGVNSSVTFYYRNESCSSNSSANGSFTGQIASSVFDILIRGYADRLDIMLRNVNISYQGNRTFGMDKHTSISGYLITYGINNTYNFSGATLTLYYDDTGYSNESGLQLHRCDSYDFVARSCSGSWSDVTSNATQNTTGHFFVINVTSFSGFSVQQYAPSAPSTPPTGTYVAPGAGCTINWSCGNWGACRPDGKQTRVCKDLGTCKKSDKTETMSCTYITPASCFDRMLNGDESDVDCGGPCLRQCDNGKRCDGDFDCLSGFCGDSVCAAMAKPPEETGGAPYVEMPMKADYVYLTFVAIIIVILTIVVLNFTVMIRKYRALKKSRPESGDKGQGQALMSLGMEPGPKKNKGNA